MLQRGKKDLSVYIHIPFCVRKCAYCDFVSGCGTKAEIEYYIGKLQSEIRTFRVLGNTHRIRTIFFGGGTPSLLEPELLGTILTQLRNHFLMAEDVEITVECNPGTLSVEKLTAYREMGVNRLSIGLQSANDEELRLLGRIHNWETFRENYELARRLGFDNINVDLISSLPGQNLESWENTLRSVAALNPDHISAYSLIIEEGTPFYERYSTPEGMAQLPDEDTDREMYRITEEILAEQGYHRYEISNYAREGKECLHNKVYWTLGEYLGFGMSAYSFLQGKRFDNPSTFPEYWEAAPTAHQRFLEARSQSLRETVEEYMFLGLRIMEGVTKSGLKERFGVDYEATYGAVTKKLVEEGLLQVEDDRVRLTERGIDLSNVALADFLLDKDPVPVTGEEEM